MFNVHRDCAPFNCTFEQADDQCGMPLPQEICDPIDFNNDGVSPGLASGRNLLVAQPLMLCVWAGASLTQQTA